MGLGVSNDGYMRERTVAVFDSDEIAELYESETAHSGIAMRKSALDGVWREQDDSVSGEERGFSGVDLSVNGDRYESDRGYNPPSHDDTFNAGWLGYQEQESKEGKSPAWLAGYAEAASSGREPYASTQERMRIDELKSELGEPEDFLDDVALALYEADLSQSALAREMGLPRQNVSRWFTGEVEPSLESMLRIQDALERLVGRE